MAPMSTWKGNAKTPRPAKVVPASLLPADATSQPPSLLSGGPALRTRGATRSPRKRPAKPSAVPPKPRKPAPKAAAKKRDPPPVNLPAALVPSVPTAPPAGSSNQPPSPYHVPFRILKPVNVRKGFLLEGYSQLQSDEEYVEHSSDWFDSGRGPTGRLQDIDDKSDDLDEGSQRDHGNPTPNTRAARKRFSQNDHELSSDDASDDGPLTRSFDQEDSTRLAFPLPNGTQTVEVELFQDDDTQPDGYLDLSPVMRAAEAYRSTVAPTSPLVARASRQSPSRKNKGKGRQVQMLPVRRSREELEAETAAIIASTQDVLDAHRAKRQKKLPKPDQLSTVANRLQPNVAPGPSNPSATVRRNPTAGPSNVAPRPTNPNRVVSLPAIPPGIIEAARQPGAEPDPDDFLLGKRRKRTSNPARHQLASRTPNTRNVLRKGKEEYGLHIVTENAYPTVEERVRIARAAHEVALQQVPDAAAVATSALWSPSKARMYGDVGWGKRGGVKTVATALTPGAFRFSIPPALAETLPGGASPFNTTHYVRSRVLYLRRNGAWLRGAHGGHTSMLYGHPIIPEVIEQSMYRPATPAQRALFSPMPLPAIALAVTAIECALEEWQTGTRMRISFTEEGYRRVYKSHLKRLESMSTSHTRLIDTLRDSMSDYCIAHNDVQQPNEPVSADEFETFNIFDSDEEDDDLVDPLEYDVLEEFEAFNA